MSEQTPKDLLDKHLTHSSKLGDIEVDFNIKALKCGFPSIESNRYIKDNVGNVIIIAARPGNGKCIRFNTPILMYSGEFKPVQDIIVGDLVMGPDSKPRTVLSLGRGHEEMFEVTPTKGDTFTCNRSHILSLKISSTYSKEFTKDKVVNVSVEDYLGMNPKFKHQAKLWRPGALDFPNSKIPPFDSYWVGLWLGDGTRGDTEVTKDDQELWDYYPIFAQKHGVTLSEHLPKGRCRSATFITKGKSNNPLRDYTKTLVSEDEQKFIPHDLLTSSREDRLKLLAGLLDSDGYLNSNTYDIVTKYPKLRDGILFLARSLGFAAYSKEITKGIKSTGFVGKYHLINISGDVDQIPLKVARKKASPRQQKKDVLKTGFTIKSVGEGDYYGFTLDGDHLFLLGDFTVSHNTALACQIGLNVSEHSKVLMFSMEMEKEELKRRLLAVTSNVPIDKLGENVFREKVAAAQAKLATLKFHINEDADLSAKQIVSKTYDENSVEKIGLVIIDYIGMLDIKASSRNEGIKEAAKIIKKQIADHLKIPVLLLAQMNRNFEDRAARGRMEYEKAKQYKNTEANEALLDVRPSMSDLAESSGIEHAADLIMFLQREYLLDRAKPESAFRVFVEKNRKGAVRDFELEFSGTLTKFLDKGVI